MKEGRKGGKDVKTDGYVGNSSDGTFHFNHIKILLNMNSINIQVNKKLLVCRKSKTQIYAVYRKSFLLERLKKDVNRYTMQILTKRHAMAILISDSDDFRTRKIIRFKKDVAGGERVSFPVPNSPMNPMKLK